MVREMIRSFMNSSSLKDGVASNFKRVPETTAPEVYTNPPIPSAMLKSGFRIVVA